MIECITDTYGNTKEFECIGIWPLYENSFKKDVSDRKLSTTLKNPSPPTSHDSKPQINKQTTSETAASRKYFSLFDISPLQKQIKEKKKL